MFHLLNTTTLKLCTFLQNVPPYVILSHTWGDEEVLFDDIDTPHAKEMRGYDKIVRSCQQAVNDGFEWIWIDTCCIDKRSSSELSEAINSMYRWYWEAAICYAFLVDADASSAFMPGSPLDFRWFKRGWTLQELLAPRVVEFYDHNWKLLGTKVSLAEPIAIRTGIEKFYLKDRIVVQDASVATRFSWASTRETTRAEDVAYCLLGLMDVNMPLLYGEGTKAFYRLQAELLKKTNEHTIFAWRLCRKYLWKYFGMLAPSPAYFAESADIVSSGIVVDKEHHITNRGLRIQLPLVRCANQYLAVLNCAKLGSDGFIAVPLHRLRNARYRRIDTDKFHIVDDAGIGAATMETLYIEAWDEGRERKNLPQLKTRVNMPYMEHSSYRLETVKTFPTSNFDDQGRPAFPMLLYNWERVGLMFCDEAKSFLVVLGQQSGTVWLRVKDPLQYASEWEEHPILAELKSVDKHRLSEKDFVGDYRRVPINGVGAQFVSVRTKLRRYGELLLVDLAIELSTS